jgi:hypothetical protein
VLKRAGDQPRAEKELESLGDGSAHLTSVGLLLFHLVCSEFDRAADWVERVIAQGEPTLLFFLRHPLANGLRASARWPALARMMNLRESMT